MLQARESQREAWVTELMLKPLNTYFYILGLRIQSAGLNSNMSHREKARTTEQAFEWQRALDAREVRLSLRSDARGSCRPAWEDAVRPPRRQARRAPAAPLCLRGQRGNHFTLTSSPAHQPEAELISKL